MFTNSRVLSSTNKKITLKFCMRLYSELDLNPPYMVSISRFLFYFCVVNYLITGNFRGRKLSWISLFCGYLRKFSPQNLVAWHPLARQKRAIRENFLRENCIFHQFVKVFSLESFPLCVHVKRKLQHKKINRHWTKLLKSELLDCDSKMSILRVY